MIAVRLQGPRRLELVEIEQRSSMGYVPEEFDLAMEYIAAGRLNVERFVSRTIALHEVQGAFEGLSAKDAGDVKVMIKLS